ncbi:glycoside hydrolase family 12 protein [Cylindrobasidium torrendii FP15055 ss-10]|uniref:Glycoside hydrolase family 12 protein n=1 Tax=Cylindrobasidium torrendii FP15055 ss-10 TaxID=1314674 RepID=A0A0D7BSA9_9AGAR|nr:glycoside hydrolase family 12 protein [Cylindrobasidium torrendii FP15055 ss-10]
MLLSILLTTAMVVSTSNAQTLTGQYDCIKGAGNYDLCQNLWGKSSGVGSQSSTLISASGDNISWSTNWTWANNENSVKSYANVESTTAKGVKLSDIKTAPTTWVWDHTTQSDGIRADVAYDIWTGVQSVGAPASANSSYEFMIWLAKLGGIQPVGSRIASNVQVAGYNWEIWRGPNTNWQVISFFTTDLIKNFQVDLTDFFDYLIANQSVSSSQYLQSIQAGTEPFTGSANLVTSQYSVSITT